MDFVMLNVTSCIWWEKNKIIRSSLEVIRLLQGHCSLIFYWQNGLGLGGKSEADFFIFF